MKKSKIEEKETFGEFLEKFKDVKNPTLFESAELVCGYIQKHHPEKVKKISLLILNGLEVRL